MASALPTRLANGLANSGLDGLGEDVPDAGNLLAENVRIYPQSDGRVSVAEASSNHVDGDPGEQQSSGVEVAQVVQPAVVGPCGSGGLTFSRLPTVMFAEHRHGFRIDADGPGPAAFGRSLDALSVHDGGRSAESTDARQIFVS
jgi:hypothetical protein